MDASDAVVQLGHLASRRQLTAVGIGRSVVDKALRSRALLPVRPGWVASPLASRAAIVAVLHGGRLTGSTALRSYGIWSGLDRRLHVAVPSNSHRVIQPPLTPLVRFAEAKYSLGGVALHWVAVGPTPVDAPAWRVPLPDALVQFAATEAAEQLAAAVESAVHEKRMRRSEAVDLIARLPRRHRRVLRRLTFLAGSGLETVGRIRFEDLGHTVEQQVQIGRDRVDLLIDGWLVVELDGDSWHDPALDRARTNRLIRAGSRCSGSVTPTCSPRGRRPWTQSAPPPPCGLPLATRSSPAHGEKEESRAGGRETLLHSALRQQELLLSRTMQPATARRAPR